MNPLTALLPSLRGVRAPLAAGALLLLATWIQFWPGWSHGEPSELQRSLVALGDYLALGSLAVASFLASIVGAVMTTGVSYAAGGVEQAGWTRQLRPWLNERGETLSEQARRAQSAFLETHAFALERKPSRRPWRYFWGGSERPYLPHRQSEWRQLRVKLMKDHPAMYDEIDRLEGEAEFRFAVAVPVACVGAAAMFRVPQHGWALLCAGVVLGILLVIAGATVTRTAERTMVDLLVSGTIVLPVEQAIAELLQEAPVNAA